MTAAEFNTKLRLALWSHILSTGSVTQAARQLGIARETLRQFLNGTSDTGLARSLGWAEKLGLPPRYWVRESGLLPEHGTYAQALRGIVRSHDPADSLILRSGKLLARITPGPASNRLLPESLRQIEELFCQDPGAAGVLAREHLMSKLRQVKEIRRKQSRVEFEHFEELLGLLGTYGMCRYSKTSPGKWASALEISLDNLQDRGDSPVLTWLMIDASALLRRMFKVEQARRLATMAAASAVTQDVSLLYPRAIQNLASMAFYTGDSKAAVLACDLILALGSNLYQPLAAFGKAVALAETEPYLAKRTLEEHAGVLDALPFHRQMQRFWTTGRVLAALEHREAAIEAFAAAVRAEFACDERDRFLVFEEVRKLAGSGHASVEALAQFLLDRLPNLTFQFPDEFIAASNYLGFVSERREREVLEAFEELSKKRGVEG